jgi:hypothetical protein
MERTRNLYAVALATLVMVVTIMVILGIWDLIEIEYAELIKNSLYSIFTLLIASAIIAFIFGVIYKTPVKPPRPPRGDFEPPASDTK